MHKRANRAQFADVAFRTVSEQDVEEVNMPPVQDEREDESE